MQYRDQGIAGICFNSYDKIFIYLRTASTKFLKFLNGYLGNDMWDRQHVIYTDTDKGSYYLTEVSGKHEITPIARQDADLTEGVLSCNAAVIYKK